MTILSQTNYGELKDKKFGIAVLTWGATEAHNFHLPYGTDNYESGIFGKAAVEEANSRGAGAVLLPNIPFGVNTGQGGIPLTINLNPSTQMKILRDILQSLRNSEIRKFLIINSHGGNDFKQMLRELGGEFPDMLLATCNWFQSVDKTRYFEEAGDHADEMETSLMLHFHPELVMPLDKAGNGASKKFRVRALNEKWAWTERQWIRVSHDTGIGNPRKATAEKGREYFMAVRDKLAGLILELDKADMESFYEDPPA